jgi:hypothetical protein
MLDLVKLNFPKRTRLNSVLGLSLDGNRLEGLVLRRSNTGFQSETPLSVSLSLDPLTAAPELVGREIRNHLDAAEIRERYCVVTLPLKWVLTSHIEVPDLPESDVASFLQLEAERGFHCDAQTLHVVTSLSRTPSGKQHALLAGIPKTHLNVLEQVLHAAKLKPVSFSLGITALQPAPPPGVNGVLALTIGQSHVGLQVTAGGGVIALRALEGALENEGGQRQLHADHVARETRITLGQLPAEFRDSIRSVRVFGPRDLSQQLLDEVELRLDSLGLKAENVTRYAPNEFGVHLSPDTPISPACSFAAQKLAGRPNPFEFLPPRVTPWQQLSARYASGKLRTILTAVGSVALVVGAFFFYQQLQLWNLEAQTHKDAGKVKELTQIQNQITQYRPWFDETVRGLTILRGLTDAFPQSGEVTAKTIEIRDLQSITCTGTARSSQALLRVLQQLRSNPQFRDAHPGPMRGQAPAIQFSFSFAWNEGGSHAN